MRKLVVCTLSIATVVLAAPAWAHDPESADQAEIAKEILRELGPDGVREILREVLQNQGDRDEGCVWVETDEVVIAKNCD